jgi:hypothetical protein
MGKVSIGESNCTGKFVPRRNMTRARDLYLAGPPKTASLNELRINDGPCCPVSISAVTVNGRFSSMPACSGALIAAFG